MCVPGVRERVALRYTVIVTGEERKRKDGQRVGVSFFMAGT